MESFQSEFSLSNMRKVLDNPTLEPREDADFKSIHGSAGGNCNNFLIKLGREMPVLKKWFPKGEANERGMVLFSTGAVHGTDFTIETVEAGLRKYGDAPDFPEDEEPEEWYGNKITILIVQPKLCTLRHGNVRVTLADIPFLKRLRATSRAAFARMGMPE